MAERSSKSDSIFWAALGIAAPEERDRYLDEACADDPNQRAQLNELLAAYPKVERFLEQPANGDATIHHEPSITERPGTVIGPYKLLQQIGEGGMGVVFMAEQTEPIQRTVALKIIKPGMDTRQVIARFEAERQALAMMDHPNIAKVLDAGTTDSGRPYFVMELVKGVPITKYCDEKHLPLRARLELLLPVCQAVQHAHQKGVIHRDIKPTNVLVAEFDDHAVPKVIDFGVAKATSQKLTDRTMFTEFGQVVGTVEYMSPEQAKFNQLDIDTRSDIYSLGVLLYELLTGSTPFGRKRLTDAAFDEALRIIREEEPQKPSTRLSTTDQLPSIAANRHSEPARLSKDVRGELDWVVMKALEKDRNRRYETANGLACDVERYLQDEPVQACPPSATYRFRKFARRNKVALFAAGAAMATLVLLVLGLAVSNLLIAAERSQKAEALIEKEQALTAAKKSEAAAQAESQRAEQGFLHASIAIREIMTKAAIGSGEWSQLPPPLRKRFAEEAIKFYEGLLQDSNPDPNLRYETAVGYRSIGAMQTTSGEIPQAEASYRHSVAILDPLVIEYPAAQEYRHQLAYTLLSLGRTLRNTKRFDEAKTALRKSAELYETLIGKTKSFGFRSELATCYLELCRCYGDTRDFEPAAEAINRGIAVLETAVPTGPSLPQYKEQLAGLHLALGQLRAKEGQVKEAKAAFRTAAERYEDAFSKQPTAGIIDHWIECCFGLMDLPNDDPNAGIAEAEQAYREFLKIESRTPADLSEHHVRVHSGHMRRIWAYKLSGAGRMEEAEQVLNEALVVFEKLMTDEPDYASNWHFAADTERGIAELMITRGAHEQAEKALRRSIERHEQRAAKFPGVTVNEGECAASYNALANLLANQPEEAAKVRAQALANYEKRAAKFPDNPDYQLALARFLRDAGDLDGALAQCSKILPKNPELTDAWSIRGDCYIQRGEFAKAVDEFSAAIKLKPKESRYWHERGYAYQRLGDHKNSIADHSKAIELGDYDADQRVRRGNSYLAMGELQNAEKDFSRAIELNPGGWEGWHARAQLYHRQHQSAKAQSDLANVVKLARNPGDQNGLAWALAVDPDPTWRNPKLAVEVAERAIAAQPDAGGYWNTLGAARYRNGQWKDAISALEKSVELRTDDDSYDWFFLAMSHWQLGEKDAARTWYDKAVEWMDKNQPNNKELLRFRAEAQELMKKEKGVSDQEPKKTEKPT